MEKVHVDYQKYQPLSEDKRTKQFNNWTLTVGCIIAIIASVVLFVVAINQNSMARLKIEVRDIAAVFTAIIVTTTCIYHAKNLNLNLTAHSLKLKLDVDKWNYDIQQKNEEATNAQRKKDEDEAKAKLLLTMEKCLEWHRMSDKTGRARAFIANNKGLLTDDNNREFVKQIESAENAEYRSAVICVMNYFENLAEGIDSGILDELYVKRIFKTMFIKYLVNLKPYFDIIEKRDGEGGIFKSFKKIAEKWK